MLWLIVLLILLIPGVMRNLLNLFAVVILLTVIAELLH